MVGRHGYPATPAAFDPQLHMDAINAFWDARVGATVALLTDLPSSGVPVGYPVWVQQVAALYIWNGTSWQTLSGSLGNILLNGGFDVWQRGLGQSTAFAAVGYTADQWKLTTATAVAGSALSESAGAFGTYGYKILATASTNAFGLAQALESMVCNRLRGKYVTFGVDLQMSTGTQQVTISLQKSATADSSVATFSNISTNTATVTTTRTRVYVSGYVPADSSSAGLRVLVSSSNMANGAFVILRAAQLEEGQFANSFRPNTSNMQAELVALNRHYVRWLSPSASEPALAQGILVTTSAARIYWNLGTPMRAVPTLGFSGMAVSNQVAWSTPVTTLTLDAGRSTVSSIHLLAGFTAGSYATTNPVALIGQAATNYVELSAEL